MRKTILGILIGVIVLLISGVAIAVPDQIADLVKGKAKAPALERIEFIHWKEGFARPTCDNDGICEPELGENPSCADCKNGEDGEEPTTSCYAFMGQYGKTLLKWRGLPVSYVINPGGLSDDFAAEAISTGAETWDVNTGTELFNNNYTISTGAETAYKVQNYVNAISFDDYYADSNIIAAANIWYSPATKEIVEFDIVLETDYVWGDASLNAELMDLQNIAIHELGHAVGLADVYETDCSEVTMYGYSGNGEIKKRTLEPDDITGLRALYGN